MNKNILIVGGGAAASALAKKIRKNDDINKIYIASGNCIKSEYYEVVDIRANDLTGLLKFALENDIHMTIPISEAAFGSDIVSFFQSNGQSIFGPVKDACNIALNKGSGKKFLYKIHAQTSKFGVFDKIQMAQDWLNNANFPVVIRCANSNSLGDRLICTTMTLANEFLDNLFSKGETGVVTEEYTFGHNFTVYYVTDGYSALPITVVGNYKFAQDGDGGFLTNGIGCYAPDYKVNDVVLSRVDNVIKNTLTALEKKGTPYVGIIGIDCTLTGDDKFYINEFKPFMQDFDCAAVLNTVGDDLIKLFNACIEGYFSDEYEKISDSDISSVSAVVTSRQPSKVIGGLDLIDDSDNIDFVNVKQTNDDKYLTVTGESFVLTRSASTLTRARNYLYDDLSVINFAGMKYRKDICS